MNTFSKTAVLMMLMGGFMFAISGCGKDDAHDHDQAAAPAVQVQDVELVQKTCPVMGLAIDKEVYVDHEGTRVYFCCAACVQAFQEDTEKYMAIYLEQLGKTPEEAGAVDHQGHDHH